MRPRGAIFDFDGTLFDSMYVWNVAGADYLRAEGRAPEVGLADKLKAMSLRQAAIYLKANYGLTQTISEIEAGVNRTVEAAYSERVQPKPGAVDFIERLTARGVRPCIATATDRYLISAALQRCGIEKFFIDILTCGNVGHGKDEPDIFRAALDALGATRENTLVFEDALHALKTAHADGFVTAAVYDPSERRQAEARALADFYLADFMDFDSFWDRVLLK